MRFMGVSVDGCAGCLWPVQRRVLSLVLAVVSSGLGEGAPLPPEPKAAYLGLAILLTGIA